MSTASLYIYSLSLFVLILHVHSAYYAYTYDDGHGNEEHCCMVRLDGQFCLATPITRSLVQASKQCHRFGPHRGRQSSARKQNERDLNKISRRLSLQAVQEMDDRILLELKTPLTENMVKNDLICLTSNQNSIDLEKCFIELANDVDHDEEQDSQKFRRQKRRQQPRDDRQKPAVELPTAANRSDEVRDETVKHEGEHESYRIEVDRPVRIREGEGLSIRQVHHLNPKALQASTRQERACRSWFRRQVRKFRPSEAQSRASCVKLTDHVEECIDRLASLTSKTNSSARTKRDRRSRAALPVGSRLFCANRRGQPRVIGQHRRSELCFQTGSQVYVEHLYTDIASISNARKNQQTLEFIDSKKKLAAELGDDCKGETNLVEHVERQPVDRPRA